MLQSGGLAAAPPGQLHPQPLRFVKHRPLRGVAHSRRISTTLLRNQGQDGSVRGRALSRHMPPSSRILSADRMPSNTLKSDIETDGSEPQRLIRRKPSDLPLKVRKTRGNRSSETDSNTSIPSNSSYNGFIDDTAPSCSIEGPQASHSHNFIPSTPSPSYSQPSLNLSEKTSSGTLQIGRNDISSYATRHLSPSKPVESPLRTTLKRHPSVKRRVFTKMLGGFQPKPKLTSPRRNGQSDSSLFRRLSGKGESSRNMRSKSFRVTTPSSDALSPSQTCPEPPLRYVNSSMCISVIRIPRVFFRSFG